MIADESLKLLSTIIDKRVSETGVSPLIPWFNKDKGYPTVGMNKEKASLPSALYLSMNSDLAKYEYPIYLTKKEIDKINSDSTHPVSVLEDEREHVVPDGHFCIVSDNGKLREVTDKMGAEWEPERVKNTKIAFVPDSPIKLYNIDQTNISEARPDLYAELTASYDMRKLDDVMLQKNQDLQAVDKLVEVQGWGCDIKQCLPAIEPAYYSISNNEIVMPPRNLYNSAELYYGDLFHNMIHYTRMAPVFHIKGLEALSHEELTADLGAALLAQKANINKFPDKNLSIGKPYFKKDENISDVLANIYHTTTYINAVVRLEKNALDRSIEVEPSKEQLRQLGKLLVKFGGDVDERYINNDRIEEYDTLKELKFKNIHMKFARLDSLHERYYSKEYLWGYDTSDPKQLMQAREDFFGSLELARCQLNEALSRLAEVHGKKSIEEYNKYERREVLDNYTLPYDAIRYINSGESSNFLSAKDKETIDNFMATDEMKNAEVRIIPSTGVDYKTLPLEKNSSEFDVEFFRVPETLEVSKQDKDSNIEQDDALENFFEQAENDAEQEEKPRRGFHR